MHISKVGLGASTALTLPSALAHPRILRYTRDAFTTFDRAAYDSAGAFLVGELERLDPTLHEPLISTTWSRDIDLRTDVSMGDDYSSFTMSTFGMVGGPQSNGIGWAAKETTTLPRANLDISKTLNALNLWAGEVAYTLPELESARLTGRPIDQQQLSALNRKHQMDLDQIVYVGDPLAGTAGLLNNAAVTNTGNVANNAGATSTYFRNKTANEIRADINELLTSVWRASGYVAPPTKLGLSPDAFGYISTAIVSDAGNMTILQFLKTNNILTADQGIELDIVSMKWLDRALRPGATTDRMVAYSQRYDYLRFPMVPLVPASTQYDGIWVKVPYYGKIGGVEFVYPETVGYRDGIAGA